MNKKFAIFDMDGTLTDSMQYWKGLGREYLRSRGVTGDIEDLLLQIKTMTMAESAELFRRECGLPGTPEQIAGEMNDIMAEHYRSHVPLKEGVREYVQKLYGQGVRMCVASATAEDLMAACLGRLGMAEYFEFFLSCETIGKGKSQPDIYYMAARRLGAAPGCVAVYEDALYALETAGRAGFYTVAVYDVHQAEEWERMTALADEIIPDWRRQLPAPDKTSACQRRKEAER